MRIDHILKSAAKRMTGVDVDVDRSFETVTISTNGQDDIFMQGDAMATRCKCLNFGIIELALAEPYAENLWN